MILKKISFNKFHLFHEKKGWGEPTVVEVKDGKLYRVGGSVAPDAAMRTAQYIFNKKISRNENCLPKG